MSPQVINGFLITMVLALIITAIVFIIIDSTKKNHHHNHHNHPNHPNHHRTHEIGNDRDKHGCLISGGYRWCHPKQRCIKPWEESC